MESERQQPPLPPQEQPGQQAYQGWQYDQDQTEPRPPGVPPFQSPTPSSPSSPAYPPQEGTPHNYREPIADMGTSLGYGQGMEYQYSDAPQPSQPMPQLRMERLQQLRQERLRRENRHLRPDITAFIPGRKGARSSPLHSLSSSPTHPTPAGPLANDIYTPDPTPSGPQPVRSRPLPDPVDSSSRRSSARLPAAEPAQDTGMIQRVRVGRAAMILSGAFIASRVLGLLRTSMFAATFGTGLVSDAYVQAFLVPDTIFNIVAGGALSSAFIPIFTKYMSVDNDEKGAWHVANTALTLATTIMVAIAVLAMIFARPLVLIYNPIAVGQSAVRYQQELGLIVPLVRIMFLQSIILGGGVIVNSVLNARQNFLLPAIGTVLYNVGLIVGLLPGIFLNIIGHNNDTIAVYCATIGVVLGAALQVGAQIPGLRKVGMHFRPSFDWRNPAVLQIGKQMLPRIFNAAMFSTTTFVDRYLIGLLGAVVVVHNQLQMQNAIEGLKTQYFQAYMLVMLPLGIFGMAMSTAAFPTLAEYVSRGRMERVREIILETLRSILFLSLPSSVGLLVLSLPIIQALLQHGHYGLFDAQSTAVPLGFYAIGLGGLAAVEILTRAFYALRDSRTPVIVSIAQFIFKIAVGLILIDPFALKGGPAWGMGALAFSTSLASLAEATVLFILLHQRIGELFQRSLGVFIVRTLAACGGMGLGIFIVRIILDALLNTTNPAGPHYLETGLFGFAAKFFKVIIELLVGAFIYLRLARLLKLEELQQLGPIKRLLDRFKLSWILE